MHTVYHHNLKYAIFLIFKSRKRDADKVLQLFISENTDYLNRLLKITSTDDGSEFSLLKVRDPLFCIFVSQSISNFILDYLIES